MENNKISMVWVGDRISPIEALCMNSYIANGHEVDLYAYSHIKGVPKDINIRDANEIISMEINGYARWILCRYRCTVS